MNRHLNAGKHDRNYRSKNRDALKEKCRIYAEENPRKMLYNGSKARARYQNLEHTITEDDIVLTTHCPVLGIELDYKRGHKKTQQPNSPSLDRIDNSKGYIPGNICVVSWRANACKKDATLNELKAIVRYLEPAKFEAGLCEWL
jgi:hypothetical protein